MKKLIFVLITALFLLVSCGEKEEIPSQNNSTVTESSSTVTEESSTVSEDLPDGSEESGLSEESSVPSEEQSSENSSDTEPSSPTITVTLSMLEGTVFDEEFPDVELMSYRYVYPQLTGGDPEILDAINKSYELEALGYMEAMWGGAADDAAALYRAAPEYYQKPTYDCGVEVVYNENGYLAILQQQFTSYTGGGYPATFYMARTYDLSTGKQLTMEDLTGLDTEAACLAAAEEFKKIIDEDPEGFYVTAVDQLAYAIVRGGMSYLCKNDMGEAVVRVCLQETSIGSYEKGAVFAELPAVGIE